jgi:hypothetical protein
MVRAVFDMMNDAYSKYYVPSEHLAVDEVIVLRTVIFKQRNIKRFIIKIYKLYDKVEYV